MLRTTSGQFPKEEGLDKVLGAMVRYESELKTVGDDNAALIPHLDALRRVTEQAMASKVSADGARALKTLLADVDAETRRLRLGVSTTASRDARRTLPQQKRKLLNHLPSTGMGKFDAELDPAAGTLAISLRVYYDFAPDDETKTPWSVSEATQWKQAFANLVAQHWGQKFRFTYVGNEYAVPRVTVSVNVVEAPESDAHFHLRVIRQQNPNEIRYEGENSPKQLLDPNVQRTATLLQNDLTVTSHKSGKAELSKRMTFEVRPAMEKLPGYEEAQGAIVVKFNDKNEIADDSGIKGLMAVLQPWPAATIGFNLIPYFNSSLSEKKETADARVATIRNTYGARVLAVYAPADASTKPLSISSSLRETAATSPGWVRLDLSPDPSFQPAPYSVAAHEVGHMFGNVDFYRDDQRNVAEKETARDGEDGGEGPSDIERALARSQKAMFQLVAAAHMTDFSPAVGVIDDSIMSMGTRVLPSHYLPFWEVLAKLTSADIPAEDWVITQ